MAVSIEYSDVTALVRGFNAARPEVATAIHQAITHTAHELKNEARMHANGYSPSGHWDTAIASISYDEKISPHGFEIEVGYDRASPQARLAHVFEYGSPTSPPHPALSDALEYVRPDFERGVKLAGLVAMKRSILWRL